MLVEDWAAGMWALHNPPHSVVEDRQIVDNVHERVIRHALPFLECFPSTLEVAQYLEKPRFLSQQRTSLGTHAVALGCAGIVRLMRGEHEAARAALLKRGHEDRLNKRPLRLLSCPMRTGGTACQGHCM